MTQPNGTPVWYELLSSAPGASLALYGRVMGWSFAQMPGATDMEYQIATAPDGTDIGGVMDLPQGAEFAPTWAVYFAVDDLDAMLEKVKSLGGKIHMDPQDIPEVGRFAFVADPQGAMFYLLESISDDPSTSFAPDQVGHCSWNELVTSDQDAGFAFYSALFGWAKAGAMPMSDGMGDYTFIGHHDAMIGAMMNAPQKGMPPFWNFAFLVADIDAAKSAIEEGGGTVRMGPMELPDDSGWMIQATDPQGAIVMFTGPRITAAA